MRKSSVGFKADNKFVAIEEFDLSYEVFAHTPLIPARYHGSRFQGLRIFRKSHNQSYWTFFLKCVRYMLASDLTADRVFPAVEFVFIHSQVGGWLKEHAPKTKNQ